MARAPGALGAMAALAAMATGPTSHAGFGLPSVGVPATVVLDDTSKGYAELPREACEIELARRGIAFARVDQARGVFAPVRLQGPLRGVTYRTALPASKRGATPFEIVDCRFALALDDFAAQLAQHGIVEVVHYSVYRPPSGHWPAGRVASRHPGAMAIDAATFVKSDGETLIVERDFHGRIGARTCNLGDGPSPTPASPANELRRIVCDAADAKIFNVELTPDFNWAHRNHFHLELTAGSHGTWVH